RPLKHLTLDEAVMKMELSDDHFMVYRSEEEQNLKVIYRRRDGSYGIIAPE
ncbi:MAG: sigma 54 modulation/S30EA ribosomal C-terminal domain-containing protein, partial [Simkania sp.]|nr:sigma 54 modulation/S30EA ribosomal C-terminal domain-containing protein [Simkania sp.]